MAGFTSTSALYHLHRLHTHRYNLLDKADDVGWIVLSVGVVRDPGPLVVPMCKNAFEFDEVFFDGLMRGFDFEHRRSYGGWGKGSD